MRHRHVIIKLIGYNEIPCFKYLNQAFCALYSFSFISFTKLIFSFFFFFVFWWWGGGGERGGPGVGMGVIFIQAEK